MGPHKNMDVKNLDITNLDFLFFLKLFFSDDKRWFINFFKKAHGNVDIPL